MLKRLDRLQAIGSRLRARQPYHHSILSALTKTDPSTTLSTLISVFSDQIHGPKLHSQHWRGRAAASTCVAKRSNPARYYWPGLADTVFNKIELSKAKQQNANESHHQNKALELSKGKTANGSRAGSNLFDFGFRIGQINSIMFENENYIKGNLSINIGEKWFSRSRRKQWEFGLW